MAPNSNEKWSILPPGLPETELVRLPDAEKSHTRSQSHFTIDSICIVSMILPSVASAGG